MKDTHINETIKAMGAHQTVLRLMGVTRRQLAFGLVLVTLFAVIANMLKAQIWLSFFSLVLQPVVISSGIQLLLHRILPQSRGWRATWISLISLILITSYLSRVFYLQGPLIHSDADLNGTQAFVSALVFCAMCLALPLWYAQAQARELEFSFLKQAALSAELKALQAQVEPHFLYNTLANTRYLVRHTPDKAAEMLDHLIAYLHGALPDLRTPMSTLEREFELAEHYLALMAIRFGSRMSFTLSCPDDLKLIAIPPMLLMTLVENAVKHGVEPKVGEVRIEVQALIENQQLLIFVRDNGAGIKSGILGSGVGLRNLRTRIAALHGRRASFQLRSAPQAWTEATLSLPAKSVPLANP